MNETKCLEVKDALSKNLVALRKKHGFSQAKLAELIEKSAKTVNEIETGKAWPDHRTIQLLAKVLGVEETDLFNDPNLIGALKYLQDKKA
jgi:transcriptional regulator with XRE-family HTH domain